MKPLQFIHMNTTRCNPRLYLHSNCRIRPLKLHSYNLTLGRGVRSTSSLYEQIVPLRKKLKDEAKKRRIESKATLARSKDDVNLGNWELTVGVEIHAELNTSRKLFSDAFTSTNGEPNNNVALFDLAYPGSQPHFQTATLIPALRAALALNCKIERKSSFDRKHYFYQDQPAGYQITQYYGKFRVYAAFTLQLLTLPVQNHSLATVASSSMTTMVSHLRTASLSPSESNRFRWSKIQPKPSTNFLPPIYSTSIAYPTL